MQFKDNYITQGEIDRLASQAKDQYHVFEGTTVTVCCLTLENGFSSIGHSACIDPANFDEAEGRYWAKRDAARKIWEPLGFHKRQKIHEYSIEEEEE